MPLLLDNSQTQILNSSIKHGDTFDPTFVLTDSDGGSIDFTGVTLLMQVRKQTPIGTVALTFTESDGITINSNTIKFNKTITIPVGEYFFDLKVNYTDGRIKTIFGGKFTVLQNVSNP